MTGYLLDTNVVSELAQPRPSARVRDFLLAEADLHLSTITLHELSYGAERAPDPARKIMLLAWIRDIATQFAGRIHPLDAATAELSGRMRALAQSAGQTADPLDVMIAAAAVQRGLTVATRNTKHFAVFGVSLRDPWK